MKATAIIPARGGSKGLPRKNVLPLAGKPLIAWTIEAANSAKEVERVFVSTDDAEIASVSRQFGAEVIWRPEEISGDLASSEEALAHAVEEMREGSHSPSLLAFLQCTSPLTTAADIDGTIASLSQGHQTAVAVADFHYFLWRHDPERNDFVGINHDKQIRQLRQQREQQYIETGAVYAMETAGFMEHKHRFFGSTGYYVLPEQRVLEIDSASDFQLAEAKMLSVQRASRLASLPSVAKAIVFDFDGVFTNDKVMVDENGVESVVCSRSDGMGISLAKKTGIRMLILSSEQNRVVRKRAEKLQLEVIHGVNEKHTRLESWLSKNGIAWNDIVYVGNDVNDLECLQRAACGVVVADARPEAKANANIILHSKGGDSAVREITELLIAKQQLKNQP